MEKRVCRGRRADLNSRVVLWPANLRFCSNLRRQRHALLLELLVLGLELVVRALGDASEEKGRVTLWD